MVRVSSKRKKKKFLVRTETNRNKICFGCVSVCFVKPKTKIFGLLRCYKPISKQPKQTELFWIKPKQTETTLNFLKNTKILSLSNIFRWSSVFFGSIIICNNWKQSSSLIWCDSAPSPRGLMRTAPQWKHDPGNIRRPSLFPILHTALHLSKPLRSPTLYTWALSPVNGCTLLFKYILVK